MKTRLLLAILVTMGTSSFAIPYYFTPIEQNGGPDLGDLLWVDMVRGNADNQVSFTFYNASTPASAITEIYFYDGSLLEPYTLSIVNGPGTCFTAPAKPKDLPGGESYGLTEDWVLAESMEPQAPPISSGVNGSQGEWVKINFQLQPGISFDNLEAELASRELIIGIRVQGVEPGDISQSYVNEPNGGGHVPVPDAGSTALLLICALAVLMPAARIRRRV